MTGIPNRMLITAVLALVLLLPRCSLHYQSASVRHKPVNLRPVQGKKPVLSLFVRPYVYGEFVKTIQLPGDKAFLYIGEALVSSYREAFSAWFEVIKRHRYADFTAFIFLEPFEAKAVYRPEHPAQGEDTTVCYTIAHTVVIQNNESGVVAEKFSYKKDMEVSFVYEGPSQALEKSALTIEEMLAEVETDLYRRLEAAWEAGTFKVWR